VLQHNPRTVIVEPLEQLISETFPFLWRIIVPNLIAPCLRTKLAPPGILNGMGGH